MTSLNLDLRTVYSSVTLLIHMRTVCLILRLTVSWRLVKSPSTKPCPLLFLSLNVQVMKRWGDSIFVEDDDDIDWDDPKPSQPATPIEPASTTSAHGPEPSTSTSWGPCELLPQLTKEAPAVDEGEATSSLGAP